MSCKTGMNKSYSLIKFLGFNVIGMFADTAASTVHVSCDIFFVNRDSPILPCIILSTARFPTDILKPQNSYNDISEIHTHFKTDSKIVKCSDGYYMTSWSSFQAIYLFSCGELYWSGLSMFLPFAPGICALIGLLYQWCKKGEGAPYGQLIITFLFFPLSHPLW